MKELYCALCFLDGITATALFDHMQHPDIVGRCREAAATRIWRVQRTIYQR